MEPVLMPLGGGSIRPHRTSALGSSRMSRTGIAGDETAQKPSGKAQTSNPIDPNAWGTYTLRRLKRGAAAAGHHKSSAMTYGSAAQRLRRHLPWPQNILFTCMLFGVPVRNPSANLIKKIQTALLGQMAKIAAIYVRTRRRITRSTEHQERNGRNDLEANKECARRGEARQAGARFGADVRRHVRCSRAAMATDRGIQNVARTLEERRRQHAPDHGGVLDGDTTLSACGLTPCGGSSKNFAAAAGRGDYTEKPPSRSSGPVLTAERALRSGPSRDWLVPRR
jgi:hypothetical protein